MNFLEKKSGQSSFARNIKNGATVQFGDNTNIHKLLITQSWLTYKITIQVTYDFTQNGRALVQF